MIEIDNALVSLDVLEKKFVCDLNACKGACCVEGDGGAPLEKAELKELDAIYETVKPYLTEEGIAAIEAQGKYVKDPTDGDMGTPLINNRECAYTVFDTDGTAKCGIEQAHIDGKIDFKKPVSCHLYPIRIKDYDRFAAVNYHHWKICDAARTCGKSLGVKVYQFLKEPLIRKFGQEWFEKLEAADGYVESQKNQE